MNPICKQLYAIFPKKISLAEDSVDWASIDLNPSSGASKRAIEHSLGRRCALKALAAIGVEGVSIGSGVNGEPIWPVDTVGSISHSKGHCFIAAARAVDFLSMGVDIEHFNRMKPRSINRITHSLESAMVGEDLDLATILFSLKEAFYKAQFPLFKTHLNFKDIALKLIPESQSAELVWATPNLAMNPEDYPNWKFHYTRIENRCYVLSHCPKKQLN